MDIEQAIKAFGEAQFECGEWNRNESDESWDEVFARAEEAEKTLRRLINGGGHA